MSDVHLSAEHPATTAAFLRFIGEEATGRTDRLYVLGDLFEYWAGDDAMEHARANPLADPLTLCIVAALRALSDSGIALAFMAGNRDFLIGDAFAKAAGLTLLVDPHRVRIGGIDLLLSHGDVLCVDDIEYQNFRAMVRNPAWQRAFLTKPLAERRAVIAGVRVKSEEAKREKAATIMDVNDGAVCALLAAHPDAILIHGHTHRPAHHEHAIAQETRERWVLT
ncbi:MAG: UDP-2,3-diacylglucosamine diphosphatase, partial [Burkholderiaceae bacterium]